MKTNELTQEQVEAAEVAIIKWRCNPHNGYSLKDLIVLLIAIAEEYDTGKVRNSGDESRPARPTDRTAAAGERGK